MFIQFSLLVVLVIALTSVVLLKKREHFDLDVCGFHYEHTLDETAKDYAKYLVTVALKDMNKKGFQFFPVNMDRISIRQSENEGFIDYKIYYFVNSWTHFSNRKLLFDLSVNEIDGVLIINRIVDGESLSPVLPRQRESERGSILFKPKETRVPVNGAESTSLSFDASNIKETEPLPVLMRNKDMPVPGSENVPEQFPVRKIISKWDSYGISQVDNKKETCAGGIYRGVRQEDKKITGFSNPTLFYRKDQTFDWLFSLTEDAASRPIGVA